MDQKKREAFCDEYIASIGDVFVVANIILQKAVERDIERIIEARRASILGRKKHMAAKIAAEARWEKY